jgi:hypothetical protein
MIKLVKDEEEIKMGSIQKEIFKNKVEKGFNTSNIELEFCFLQILFILIK